MTETILSYLKISRFDHWIKQLFILPGMVFAFFLLDNIDYDFLKIRIILGFLAACFAASANYIINEWLDAEFDKFHPVKKNRPVIAAKLKGKYIVVEYIFFFAAGCITARFASGIIFAMTAALLIMGILYNVRPVRSKEIPYFDVLSESVNNALRLLIGWFCVTSKYLPPASIVFGYWMGGAFLMAAKRFAEYRMIGDKTQAGLYRKSFKYYSEKSLLISAFFYAMASVFFCGIFMIKYRIELLLAIPFLCGLFCFYLYICYKPDSSAQRPEKLFREKGLLLYILFFIVWLGILMVFPLPFLQRFLETSFIGV
jgi:4-hydroxybenzoate polyprenyltransferase